MSPKIATLRSVMDTFRPVGEPTINMVIMFLAVAHFEGRSLREYMDMTGYSQSSASRYLLDMGAINRFHEQGMDIIQQETDPVDRRRNIYTLTPKGRDIINQATRLI